MFLIGRSCSYFGNALATMAFAFATLDVTHSPSKLAFVVAVRTTASILTTLWGGILADRISRSVLIRYSNLLLGITQAFTALIVIEKFANLWILSISALVSGLIGGTAGPASQALIPEIASKSELQASNAFLRFSTRKYSPI